MLARPETAPVGFPTHSLQVFLNVGACLSQSSEDEDVGSERRRFMKTLLALVLTFAFLPTAFADNHKEQERVKESGEVLKEASVAVS